MGKMIKFDYVNDHGNFEAVLAHLGIEYTRKGSQLRLLCPLPDHDDTNPSFSVTLEATADAKANTWHCFGCQNSGSLIDVVAHVEGIDLRAAATLVAEVSGCSLAPSRSSKPKKAKKGSERRSKRREGSDSKKGAAPAENGSKPPSSASEEGSEAEPPNQPLRFSLTVDTEHPYVLERLGSDVATIYGVGVCDPQSRSMMAGRCCVPIHNRHGKLIAYAGRYLGDDPEEPKWKLPPKFEKSRVLFNAERLRSSLSSHVVLVEGFFDAIALDTLGIPVVSCMGTAVSEEQVLALAEIGVRRVTVLFDGDDEGQAAAQRAVPMLASALFVRSVSPPVGCDPDQLTHAQVLELVGDGWL